MDGLINAFLFFLFFCFFSTFPVFGQERGYSILQKELDVLVDCLDNQKKEKKWVFGKTKVEKIGPDEVLKLKEKAMRKINDFDNLVKDEYPVYLELVEFLDISISPSPSPLKSCKAIQVAASSFASIDTLGSVSSAKRYYYKKYFGIDANLFARLYGSDFCKQYEINEDVNCLGRVPEIKTVPELLIDAGGVKIETNLSKGVIQFTNGNNDTLVAYDPIELLRKAISRDLLDSDFLDIEQLYDGDSRIIPGQNGVPYELKFKHEDTKKKLFFAPGEYTLVERIESQHNNSWDKYVRAVSDFKNIVLMILDEYGNNAFTIFIQGSADSLPFKDYEDKPLDNDYNSLEYQLVQVLAIVDSKLEEQTIDIGQTYSNDELPDLRAAFVRNSLLKIDRFQKLGNHLNILKGEVTEKLDKEERNCVIYLYIDWDAASRE